MVFIMYRGNLLDEVEEIGSGIARRLDLIHRSAKAGVLSVKLTTLLKSETGQSSRRSSFRRSNRCYGSRSATRPWYRESGCARHRPTVIDCLGGILRFVALENLKPSRRFQMRTGVVIVGIRRGRGQIELRVLACGGCKILENPVGSRQKRRCARGVAVAEVG